jgi:hypothetical protein
LFPLRSRPVRLIHNNLRMDVPERMILLKCRLERLPGAPMPPVEAIANATYAKIINLAGRAGEVAPWSVIVGHSHKARPSMLGIGPVKS